MEISKRAYRYAAQWLEVDCDTADIDAKTYEEEEMLRAEIREIVKELQAQAANTYT